jgi:hypothetical protein
MRHISFGWLVFAALAVNLALFALMIFGTLAHLSGLAEGAEPFDLRPLGYTVGDARSLLALLGEEGRAYYASAQLALDSIYPATYALSRALLLWWLTVPGRLSATMPRGWRFAMLVLPACAAGFDYFENARIAAMLVRGAEVDPALVASASLATQAKALLTLLTDVLVVLLGLRAALHWRRTRTLRARQT